MATSINELQIGIKNRFFMCVYIEKFQRKNQLISNEV